MMPLEIFPDPVPEFDDASLYLFLIVMVLPFLFYAYKTRDKLSHLNNSVYADNRLIGDIDVLGQEKPLITDLQDVEEAVLFEPLTKVQWIKSALYFLVFYLLLIVLILI